MLPCRRKSFRLLIATVLLCVSPLRAFPAPESNLAPLLTSRIAAYDDISSEFQLVYSTSDSCPSDIVLGEPVIDERNVAVLSLSAITEDTSVCSGTSSLVFLGEENVRRDDDLLTNLQLGGMQEAFNNNPNARQLINNGSPPSLLVGWHQGDRSCGSSTYPETTIYFVINEAEDKTISFKKPAQREQVTIPPSMRSFLIVAPNSNICLLIDPTSNANDNVRLTITPDDGSTPTTTLLTPGGSTPPQPAAVSPTPGAPAAVSSPTSSTAVPIASPTAPASPSPVAPVASPAPGSGSGSGSGAVVVSGTGATPTASPVSAVGSGVVTPSPFISVAPTASVVGVSAAMESPGIVEVATESDEESILEEASEPPGEDDGSACFPGSASVKLDNGNARLMRDLQVGDRVLTKNGVSDVILFTHRELFSRNSFLRITTEQGDSLIVSPGHYVYSNMSDVQAAEVLRVGDALIRSDGAGTVIVNIERVSAVGLFNPQTVSGSIIVDGFLTSTYTTAVDAALAHSVLLLPIRLIYAVSPKVTAFISNFFDHGSPLIASLLPKSAFRFA